MRLVDQQNRQGPLHNSIGAAGRNPAEADEHRVLAAYQSLYAQHGAAPVSLGLRPTSQAVRFRAVLENFRDSPPESLIDLGCGFGDLLPFLREGGWAGTYLGLDMMPEFIEVAHERHERDPSAFFMAGHVLTQELPAKGFDWCVALGLCNHQREAGAMAFIEALIARSVALARRTVLVDFLSTTSDRRRDDLFFTDPSAVAALALRHSRRVVVDHSYMPFEFMLKIRVDDYVVPNEPFFSEPL
ncbi:MAG TPA: class I SAM-dependent methyltransferase [Terracidiphilus sp.]|jgi:SAM-dependent methyltransferase|nr:class I SAM-dependent methyltransferase [Terracidiphilus sp.]